MKVYVRTMSLERNKALRRAGEYSQATIEHIIKILAYSDIRKMDVDHWIGEIAQWFHEIDGITIEPKNTKLKLNDILRETFGSMGDELNDYQNELRVFLFDNKRGYFNYESKKPYPDFEITDDLVKMFKDCCDDIVDEITPLLIDKQDHSKQEYQAVLHNIFSKYI